MKSNHDALLLLGDDERFIDVIRILNMLGGRAGRFINGKCTINDKSGYYYFINKTGHITSTFTPDRRYSYNFIKMTLKEFESRYPYRPGNEVRIPSVDEKTTFTITSARWNGAMSRVEYYVDSICAYFPTELLYPVQKDEEEDIKVNAGHDVAVPNCPICPEFLDEDEVKKDEKLVRINMTSENCHDEVEIILGDDFELKTEDNGRIKLVRKKTELPKTYTECCRLLSTGYNHYLEYLTNEKRRDFEYHLRNDLSKLAKLIVCRNAYWKLTGDPSDAVNCYSIIKRNGEPTVTICGSDNKGILAFLECKAAEEFIKNFGRSIKECKLV